MGRPQVEKAAAPIRAAVITVSDTVAAGQRQDRSGPVLQSMLREKLGAAIEWAAVVPDDREAIAGAIRRACDQLRLDLVLTTGGTGVAPRDVTPEATRSVLEKEAPGIAEAIRWAGLQKTRASMLSRAVAGIRGRTLIINLPGSPRGASEGLDAVWDQIPHAVGLLRGEIGLHAG
ncbi:MAG: MogA/MoaB family molybdenum cofactor biosynthesis protein [Bacillota bacterium]